MHKYTMADVESVRDWFSDAYKDVHGIRPRGFSDEAMIHWVNTTDVQAEIDAQEEQDREMLERMGFWKQGMTLGAAWDAFYEFREEQFQKARSGKQQPIFKSPADQQLHADRQVTDLEMLDPTINPRGH